MVTEKKLSWMLYCFFWFDFRPPMGVRPVVRGRGRTAAGSRSAGGRAFLLNGFLPALNPVVPGYPSQISNYGKRPKQVTEVSKIKVVLTFLRFFINTVKTWIKEHKF